MTVLYFLYMLRHHWHPPYEKPSANYAIRCHCPDLHPCSGAQDVECAEKRVQQRSVIGVANIIVVKLPVRLRVLPHASQIDNRLVENAFEPGTHLRTEIFIKRGRAVAV